MIGERIVKKGEVKLTMGSGAFATIITGQVIMNL